MSDCIKILLVEDDEDDYLLTDDFLRQCTSPSFTLQWVTNSHDAIEALQNEQFDLCLLDYILGAENAIDVLTKLKSLKVNIPVVILTGQADSKVDDMVMRAGADDFLTKQEIETPRFMRTIRYAMVRREIEAERLERNRMEQQNKAKDKFLAHLGHELRTPLTSIIGYTELLMDSKQNADIEAELATIFSNSKHLLSLLNDLLDMSRIMANKLELVASPINICSFMTDVYALMVMSANEKRLTLKFSSKGKIPETISVDPTRLRQVLINLINNAIKFTDSGQVEIVVFLSDTDSESEQSKLGFSIIDTGIGMPLDKLERIFQPFEQIEDLMQANHGGAGLGLAISRELVTRMGGLISVDSTLNRGSTFTFTVDPGDISSTNLIDLSLDLTPKNRPLPISHHVDGRVLVVDDLREIRKLTGRLVEMSSAIVTYAKNGKEAVEMVQTAEQNGKPYHMILMDIHMPVMNGIEALKSLRSKGIQTAVIAVTAASRKGLKESLLEEGFDDVIAKPIERNELIDALDRYLISRTPISKVGSPRRESSASPLLLVEDDPDAGMLMKILLESLGHEVLLADSGKAAEAILQEQNGNIHYTLLDLHLPDCNGFELAQKLKAVSPLMDIIIISGSQPDPEKLHEYNISQTLLKPVSKNDLASLNLS